MHVSFCAKPLPSPNIQYCAHCINQKKHLNSVVAALEFKLPVSKWVKDFKYNGKLYYAKVLARFLIQRLEQHFVHSAMPDIIIPMPMARKRQQQRGFNQSLEIARIVAAHFNIPLDYSTVKRNVFRASQAQQTRNKRKNNISCLDFSASDMLKNLNIAIIDDVYTTGLTMDAVAKCLKRYNVKSINAYVVTRAL